MPSGSRPFAGSSRMTTRGSPRRTEAMPSRCFIPNENCPARFLATSFRPTISSTSSTRLGESPLLTAIQRKWLRALRPECAFPASSNAPTSCSGFFKSAYFLPSNNARPACMRSRPIMQRMVVLLPEPFGPRNPVTTPVRTENERSSTAVVDPYLLVNPSTSITTRP